MKKTNILVVYDPTTESQPALDRAAVITSREDVKIHVYSCIYAEFPTAGEEAKGTETLVAAQQEILTRAVAPLVEKGVEVTTEVEWDKDWYQAVVRASERNGSDTVLKASHKHSATQRLLKKSSDRTLMRQCACPVLLVKAEVTNAARIVLAAVQFRGDKDSYEQLNKNVLAFCERYLASDNAKLHFVNAYKDLPDRPDRGQLIRACGVPSEQVHIENGDPDKVIIDKAVELGANLVVIGNSGRAGLSAVINTNTAEKVLDELDCDVLAMP